MDLPRPNEKEIEEFKELYERRTGIKLSQSEAEEAATVVAQLYYVRAYAVMHMDAEQCQPSVDGEQGK